MSRLRHLLPAAAVAAVAVGFAGCGDKKLDTAKLEDRIREGIQRQAGIRVKSVDCPDDVKVKKNDTFDCRATTTSGQTARVRVTQQDDEGNVNYQVGN